VSVVGVGGAEVPVDVREAVDVSVIVPVDAPSDSLVALYREFSAPLREAGLRFEFVFAAYAWLREHTQPVEALARDGEPIRLYEVGHGVGESTLLKLAAERCRGRVLITLPTYRQVEAGALPLLVKQVEEGCDVVVARRFPRVDSIVNRLQSWVLHRIVNPVSGGGIHDVACGVRALRPEVLGELPLYGDFARFLPLLALREGWRVQELPATVHPKAMAARLYGPGVYLRRLIDVMGLLFLLRFTEKPLRFFGLIGSAALLPGLVILAVVFVQRLAGQGIAERPLLLLGVLLTTLGVQAIALGLVGEMIVHLQAPRRRSYRLRGTDAPPRPPTRE
jgi:hypothetical protein